MSMVAPFVEATDGCLYKNPVLRGQDWFICFDDDEPPEIVIKLKEHESRLVRQTETVKRAREILDETIGKDFYSLYKRVQFAQRDFTLKGQKHVQLEHAGAIFFVLRKAIPVPKEHDGKYYRNEMEKSEGVFYLFSTQPT